MPNIILYIYRAIYNLIYTKYCRLGADRDTFKLKYHTHNQSCCEPPQNTSHTNSERYLEISRDVNNPQKYIPLNTVTARRQLQRKTTS